jgi:hypothetical protein
MYRSCLALAFCSVFFISCGKEPARNSGLFQLADQTLDAESIDRMIAKREADTLSQLQKSAYHKNKTLADLTLLARVGKASRENFNEQLSGLSSKTTAESDILFLQYRRIWYLADAAYRPINFVKFTPATQLIPYISGSIPSRELSWLLPVFEAELKKESKDPRALGHECSETLKLQAIVSAINAAL